MIIFDLINNEYFFKPFCSKNRVIYFECICKLIEKSKGRPVLYDIDARDCINIYFNNTKIDYIEEFDDLNCSNMIRNGADIIRYFRECGWLTEKEIGRNGEYETHVTSYCRRIIEYLLELTEKNNDGALSNKIIDIHEILQSAFSEQSIRSDRPYINILKPLIENIEDLKEELYVLNENISKIMESAMDLQNMKGFGKFILKDDVLEKFFNDYFYIKNNGTIAIIIGKIKQYLKNLSTEEWIDKIATNYVTLKEGLLIEAREMVSNYLYDIRSFITNDYQEYIDYIETKINNYYSLAHAKMMMFSKSGINIEAALDELLKNAKRLNKEEQTELFERIADCLTVTSQKYVSTKSFTHRKRRRKQQPSSSIDDFKVSNNEIEALTKDMFSNRNRFTNKQVTKFLNEKFNHRKEVILKNEMITNQYDALMYASAITLSGTTDFDYYVKVYDEVIDYGFVKISNIQITKKEVK